MIKQIAKNNLPYHCKICRRTIKNGEQYLEFPSPRIPAENLYHVSCIMEICGQEVEPGMTWKTKDELELDQWLEEMKQRKTVDA